MICRDDLPETPDWTLPPRQIAPPSNTPTIAVLELDGLGDN